MLLADSTRNYMTKFLSDEWMEAHGYVGSKAAPTRQSVEEERWGAATIADLHLRKAVCVPETVGGRVRGWMGCV